MRRQSLRSRRVGRALFELRKNSDYPLGDVPLIVLSRGTRAHDNEELEEERRRNQAELARLSRQGKQLIARGSGHHIQLEDPELVISAIRDIVDATKR